MASDSDRQGCTDAHPVEGMAKLSLCRLQALKVLGITAIDSLVAGDAVDGGGVSLCLPLDADVDTLGDVLQSTHGALCRERYREPLVWMHGSATEDLLEGRQQQTEDRSATGDEKP
jgi:hypothetical protein